MLSPVLENFPLTTKAALTLFWLLPSSVKRRQVDTWLTHVGRFTNINHSPEMTAWISVLAHEVSVQLGRMLKFEEKKKKTCYAVTQYTSVWIKNTCKNDNNHCTTLPLFAVDTYLQRPRIHTYSTYCIHKKKSLIKPWLGAVHPATTFTI